MLQPEMKKSAALSPASSANDRNNAVSWVCLYHLDVQHIHRSPKESSVPSDPQHGPDGHRGMQGYCRQSRRMPAIGNHFRRCDEKPSGSHRAQPRQGTGDTRRIF
jgi:hypothetical protein